VHHSTFPSARYSLRLVFLLHIIRFTAKSAAPLGSSCQSRLCSSARRLPQNRAVLASAPFGSAPLRRLTAPPFAKSFAIHETNVFYWPAKAKFFTTKTGLYEDATRQRRGLSVANFWWLGNSVLTVNYPPSYADGRKNGADVGGGVPVR